ncbi:hypothetical protein PVT71_10225 [Salipiger sp. H15]|uniref:Secreted protein n=1 Tax=Alloyangia sp. H15 TaxID=3029062 RepID=A0AAU8AEB3_9RHOB
MLKFLKIGVSTLVLSTFVVAPVVMVVTADHAYAKNDGNNGNGGGNGGGKSSSSDRGNGGGNGMSASARDNAGQGGKSLGQGIKGDVASLGRSLKAGIGGIFGEPAKGNSATRRATETGVRATGTGSRRVSRAPTEEAPVTSVRPPEQVASRLKGPMHPSNLGKLNGALNSSPRAKEAHIANGNYGIGAGPVGLAAALAVADYDLDRALASRDAIVAAEDTLALAEAFDLVANRPTEAEIADAQDVLADPEATDEAKALAQEVLDYPDTSAAEAVIDGQEQPTEAELAAAREVIDAGVTTGPDYDTAALSVLEIEDAILSGTGSELTGEEAGALLDAIRASNPDPETVGAALERQAARGTGIGGEVEPEDELVPDETEAPVVIIVDDAEAPAPDEASDEDTVAGL